MAVSIATSVTDSLFGVIKKEIGYMWNCTLNVEKLKDEVEKLKVMKGKVQQLIDIAIRKGDRLSNGVEEWVKKADTEISKADEFLQQEANATTIGLCGNWGTLHRYGKSAATMTPALLQLQERGKDFATCVSVETPAPGPLDVYQNKDLDDLHTHNSALGDIIKSLEDDSIQITGIYGLGGVGKTTLAKEVVAKVKHLFADVAFITVSQTVNAEKIKKDLESSTKRILKEEKVLIILDDVWEKLDLEELCIPINRTNCKILLTSRSESVCEHMNAQSKICVNSLPTKEAWILFKRVAGERVETDADLKPVAEEVAKECGGLPLLIQVVGSTLKNKSIRSWNLALSRLKKPAPSEINPDIRKAFTRLQLSYDYLESEEAKSCFLLCSMFPEDHDISLEDLVYYMVGLHKFDDLESMEDARDRVKNAVNLLTSSCLLLNVEDEDEEGPMTKMHDVVRDVALLIASKGEKKYLVKAGKGLTEWLPLPTDSSLKSYAGISLMWNFKISKLPDYEVDLSSLDIFLLNDNGELPMISDEFIGCMKEVKVLDMWSCWNAQLPQSLKLLTKLRMLNLEGNKSFHNISLLGEMKELEILVLNKTGIKEIPQEIGRLVNLRVLQVKDCEDLSRITHGVISALSRLEELHIKFKLKFKGAFDCIVEVMGLSKLAYLDLTVPSIDDIPGECFNSEKLKEFVIQIGEYDRDFSTISSISWSGRYLIISGEHLVIPSLKWLKKLIEVSRPHIYLDGIENLSNIMPTLCNDEGFNKLEHLELDSCPNVSCIVDDGTRCDGDEGKREEKFFKELKQLQLWGLEKLEVIWKCPDEYISLTNLVTLKIWKCHKLERVFTVSVAQGLVNLKELTIWYCDGIEEVIYGGTEEMERGVGESEEIVVEQQQQHSSTSSSAAANNNIIIVFPSLAKITLGGLSRLESFFNNSAGGGNGNGNCSIIIKYPSLVDVFIDDCESMKKWGPGIHETPNLKTLVVNRKPVPILDGACALNEAVEKKWRKENQWLESMVAGVSSNDNNMQLEATTQFRELLSKVNPPIEEVIQAGVVPRFVEFLMRETFPQLQYEAAWALTNITSGTSENTKVVIDHGAVPIFVKLLSSPSDDVREKAVWALGNVAAGYPRCRDLVLGHGALTPLLSQLNEHAKLSMLRIATRTLSNFCRGKPHPPFEQTRPALPALGRLIHSNDEKVLTYACWALFFLSDGTHDKIQAVIDAGVCRRLVELLLHPSPSVLFPALRTVGNIVTGDDLQTQHIIEHGALPCLLSLLTDNHEKIIKQIACWTISKVTARNKEQIQIVIEAGLIAPLVHLLQTAEFDIKIWAVWAISNATSGGTNDQIKYLVSQGCIKPLCDLLVGPDPRIVAVALKGLENILKAGEVEKNAGNSGEVNFYARLLESLPAMVAGVSSNDNNMQLEATTQFRNLLSIVNPPIEEVIQAGVVPRFVEFLMRETFPQLQCQAAGALTNIASGTSSENTKVVIDHGAVPIFVKLLSSPSDDVREKAVWALGNVAAGYPRCRDLVLGHGALTPLLSQLNEHAKLSMLRIATRTLSNFCRGKPHPPFEQTRPALPALGRLIHSNDEKVLTYACWALFFLSDGTHDKIQAVIDAGVCRRLVELLLHPSPSVLFPALRTVGNIVTGDDLQTQHIIEHGALPCLLSLLTDNHEKIIKQIACWTISKVTARNKEQIQIVIEAGLIAPLVHLLQTAEFDIKIWAVWAISNATSGGTNDQIKYLVSQGCIKPLCDLLVGPDPRIVAVALKGLENILKAGEVEKNAGNSGEVNFYARLLESLPAMVAGVSSNDNNMQLEATTQFRNLLSIVNPPIEEVIQAGVVPRFVEFLMRETFPQLQCQAAGALTNIASGTSSENTKVVIDHGAVPIFVKLLSSPSDDVREKAVWALGNVAAGYPRCRDLVLGHGALIPLLSQLNEHAKLSMLRIATRTLSNFCRGKPHPPFEQTRPALPALGRLIHSNDEKVLTYACWALFFLSDGTNDKIQAVIDAGVCRRLVELLLHPSPSVLIPALRTVGNIVAGDDLQTQHIIEHGALPCLWSLLTDNHEKIIKQIACWTISKVTARNKEQIQVVIEAGLIAPLVHLFQTADIDIKKMAALAISNATSGGTNDQIKYLVSQGCIKALCDLLVGPDPRIVTVALKGLENILKAGEVEKNAGNSGEVNFYAQLIDDAEGLEKIKNLQSHDKNEINEKAVKILETYWLEEEEETVGDGAQAGGNNVQVPSGGFNFNS